MCCFGDITDMLPADVKETALSLVFETDSWFKLVNLSETVGVRKNSFQGSQTNISGHLFVLYLLCVFHLFSAQVTVHRDTLLEFSENTSSSDSSDSSSIHVGVGFLFKKQVLTHPLGMAKKGWKLVKHLHSDLVNPSDDDEFKNALQCLEKLKYGQLDADHLQLVFSHRISFFARSVVQCSYNGRTMGEYSSYNVCTIKV